MTEDQRIAWNAAVAAKDAEQIARLKKEILEPIWQKEWDEASVARQPRPSSRPINRGTR